MTIANYTALTKIQPRVLIQTSQPDKDDSVLRVDARNAEIHYIYRDYIAAMDTITDVQVFNMYEGQEVSVYIESKVTSGDAYSIVVPKVVGAIEMIPSFENITREAGNRYIDHFRIFYLNQQFFYNHTVMWSSL